MADYIDREKVTELIDYHQEEYFEAESYFGLLKEDFLKLPFADVAPVVHGWWVQTGGKYSRHKTIDRRILTCSVCGNALSMEGVNAGRGDANYCPNCGAKMDYIVRIEEKTYK